MLFDYINKRRMGILDVLRMSRYIISKDFKNYFKILIYMFLPVNIFIGIIQMLITDISKGFDFSVILQSSEKLSAFISSAEYALINKYNIAMMLIELFFVPLIIMAVARVVKNYCTGIDAPFNDVLKETITKGSTLVFATLMYLAVLIGGVMCFIIPGVVLFVFLIFYSYIIMLKGCGPFQSLKTSIKTVGKRWFWVALYALVFYMVRVVLAQIIYMLIGFLAVSLVPAVIVSTIASITDLLYYTAMTILFLNIDTGAFAIKKKRNVMDDMDRNI